MLTDEEKREIEAEIAQYEYKRAGCIDALQTIQRHHGWVSDEHLGELAALIEMTPDELDAVASYYNMVYRRPVGRHVILVCNSVTCWMLGYNPLRAALKEQLGLDLGQTTADGRFTLLPIVCLGACDRAPAMMIDDTLYASVTPERLAPILADYR